MGKHRERLRRVWHRVLPDFPLPLRVAPGIWWLARNDAVSDDLFAGIFERGERRVFAALLKPGMAVLDIGAHAGLYTLVASKLVGPAGHVTAFEPSLRERTRLMKHLAINHCGNVTVQPVALGETEGEATLYVVQGNETGCNSLRPGDVGASQPLQVPLRRLDDLHARGEIGHVDVVKMDVEGAELSVLRGAEAFFREVRPVLLCEIEDAGIAPWGYNGREIIDLVAGWGYDWSRVDAKDGRLQPLAPGNTEFTGNFLARPR